MALITCKECGRQVSEFADVCPECGYPIAKDKQKEVKEKKKSRAKEVLKSSKAKKILIISSAVILVSLVAILVWTNTCHNHLYTKYEIIKTATCEHTGQKQLICSNCGKKGEIVEIPVADHSFSTTKTIKKETCTENGTKLLTCSICGKQTEKTIVATGHEYSPATCTDPQTCIKCGQTVGDALGHWFINDMCVNCGAIEEIPEFKAGDIWEVDGLFKLQVDGASVHYECNFMCDDHYAEVIHLDYQYSNYGYRGPAVDLLFNVSVTDEEGVVGCGYPCTHEKYALACSPGQSCVASTAYGLYNQSKVVRVYFEFWNLKPDYTCEKIYKAIFEVPIS